MQKITPFIWFNDNAEEATNYYVSIFKNSKVLSINRYEDTRPGETGEVLTTSFILDGQEFAALNGGPLFNFTEAISFVINCETQEEIDYYWYALTSNGGQESMCGWLKDKFGVSWQVVPVQLPGLLGHPDPAKAKRVMTAMLKMRKLDLSDLLEA
jgi:predicted 3-demethylubiquinone-9 3-methyltransferase (glyoxalase superfamily)